MDKEQCPGCGAQYVAKNGPVHAYMTSSPACFAAYSEVLAAEYQSSELMETVHRLSVDAFAVQHPGSGEERRQVQSVGLHLARLYLQLERERPPMETNAVMLDFSRSKATLRHLPPPTTFSMTVADVRSHAGTARHQEKVRAWASAAWNNWSEHHDYIREWIATHSDLV